MKADSIRIDMITFLRCQETKQVVGTLTQRSTPYISTTAKNNFYNQLNHISPRNCLVSYRDLDNLQYAVQ